MQMFTKESKKDSSISKYAFPNEDDEQDEPLNIPKQSSYGAPPVSYPSKYETQKQLQMPQHPPAGPSVLDKFGKEYRLNNLF